MKKITGLDSILSSKIKHHLENDGVISEHESLSEKGLNWTTPDASFASNVGSSVRAKRQLSAGFEPPPPLFKKLCC